MSIRIKLLAIGFLILFLFISARLFSWQVLKAKDLAKQARNQYESGEFLQAPRGSILAKDESWLVARGEAYLVYAEIPKITETPKDIANELAPFFVDDASDKTTLFSEVARIQGLLEKKETVWVALKQKVTPDIKTNIEALKINGIGFDKVEDRLYPEASAAAQLLGFVGKTKDGTDMGYFGLEGYYDISLTGKPGFDIGEKDPFGRPILIGDSKEVSAVDGVDLVTNIDKSIQLLIEKKLEEGVQKYEAIGGSVTIMDPSTGAILAMSAYPSFDPREYWKYSNDLFKNPVVSSTFEPGSIFKVVVMASGLDAGVLEPDTVCDICAGPLKVDKYYIDTWNNKYNPGSTMTDVIVHSDNVGMAFVGQKLGADKLYDYLDKFGFGRITGIDLQGEASPKLRQKGTWNIVDLATTSFGQGIAVTPIQMVKAVGIIANGGVDVTPQVVAKLKGVGWEDDIKPVVGKRIISETAAREISDMMVLAAKTGESKWTYLTGYSIAGKTGTAQIPIEGHYDPKNTIASFIGFAPETNPKFVMLVTLNQPQSSQWASETAAPLWYSIAKEMFPYLGIQPEN